MAQTTGALSSAAAVVSVSTDASSFTDISGYSVSVSVTGGDQIIGAHQANALDAAVVTGTGRTEPYTITVRAVYTITDNHPFDLVWDRFKGSTKTLCVRWSHGSSGIRFTTTDAAKAAAKLVPILSCTPPGVDEDSYNPVLFSFSVRAADLLKTTF